MTRKQPKRTPRPGVDAYGRTPLHYAAADCNADLVRSLIEGGSDPNVHDDNGWTPLHYSAQAVSIPVTEQLLSAGARVDARDNNGNTPLSGAVFNSRGDGLLIQLLRRADADCLAQNNYGVSPASLARSIANYDVAQFFADVPLHEA